MNPDAVLRLVRGPAPFLLVEAVIFRWPCDIDRTGYELWRSSGTAYCVHTQAMVPRNSPPFSKSVRLRSKPSYVAFRASSRGVSCGPLTAARHSHYARTRQAPIKASPLLATGSTRTHRTSAPRRPPLLKGR